MILKNKIYTDIEFLDLVCNNSMGYTLFDRDVKYTIEQISTIINGTCFEVLLNYPLDEADYLNETHHDDTYVIVEALHNDVPVKRFFELPSNSAIIKEALYNDLASTHFLMLGRHNCKSRMLDEVIKTRFNKTFGFGDFKIEPDVPIGFNNRRYDNHILYARTLLPESCHLYKDTESALADSITDTIRYAQRQRAKAKEKIKEYEKMKIENVIFNDPATIVFWRDGSKTVVKAKDEPYDPEKGLAMAIAKKAYGNEGNYYNEFKKFIKDAPKDDNTY